MSYTVWIIPATILLVLVAIKTHKLVKCATYLADIKQIQKLLDPPDTPLAALLLARSTPNARLKRAFHINNTFTNPDLDLHTTFVKEAAALLAKAVPRGDWTDFSTKAVIATIHFKPAVAGDRVPFAQFVRSVTMATILTTLFDVEITALDVAHVATATEDINSLWCLSKTSPPTPECSLSAIQLRLNALIRQWVPIESIERNPLDLIIPAYETVWRIVAAVLARLPAGNVTEQRRLDYTGTFSTFLTCPSSKQFKAPGADTPSVEAIVLEGLRLHPPVRHIWRTAVAGTVQAADIAALHTSSVWGPAATLFDPSRHAPGRLTVGQREAFMPFGYGKVRCIAQQWSINAIGMLVAAIITRDDLVIVRGETIGGRTGWGGWEMLKA